MRLVYEHFDARGRHHKSIIDQGTGKPVGEIYSGGSGPESRFGIRVSLFGDIYREEFLSHDEVKGFLKGVEAVLNHMLGDTLAQQKADAA